MPSSATDEAVLTRQAEGIKDLRSSWSERFQKASSAKSNDVAVSFCCLNADAVLFTVQETDFTSGSASK